MRILQEANPIWRVASWGLAISAVGLTLCVLRLAQSTFPLRHERGEGLGEVSNLFQISAFQFFRYVEWLEIRFAPFEK